MAFAVSAFLFSIVRDLKPKRADGVKKNRPVDCFLADRCAGGYREQCGAVDKQGRFAKQRFVPPLGPYRVFITDLSYGHSIFLISWIVSLLQFNARYIYGYCCIKEVI